MHYFLLYDTPTQGLLIALADEPNKKGYSVAAYDSMNEVRKEFQAFEAKLRACPPKEVEGMAAIFVFLSPLVARLENQEELGVYVDRVETQPVYIFNPFDLPKYCVTVDHAIRKHVVFDMYEHFKNKLLTKS